MIKCSRSLPRQDNTRVSFKRKSRYLDFSEVRSERPSVEDVDDDGDDGDNGDGGGEPE